MLGVGRNPCIWAGGPGGSIAICLRRSTCSGPLESSHSRWASSIWPTSGRRSPTACRIGSRFAVGNSAGPTRNSRSSPTDWPTGTSNRAYRPATTSASICRTVLNTWRPRWPPTRSEPCRSTSTIGTPRGSWSTCSTMPTSWAWCTSGAITNRVTRGGAPGPHAAVEAGYWFDVRRCSGVVVAGSGLWPPVGRRSLHPVHGRYHRLAPRAWCGGRRMPSSPVWVAATLPFPRSHRSRSWSRASLPMQSTFLLLAPLMHAAGGWVVLLHLFSGNKVVLWSGSLDPSEVWRTIEREKVTATSTVGDAVMRPLLDAWDDFDPKPDIGSLAVVSSGGAPLSTALRDRFLATFPSIPLSDAYGSSETGIQAGPHLLGADRGQAGAAVHGPTGGGDG